MPSMSFGLTYKLEGWPGGEKIPKFGAPHAEPMGPQILSFLLHRALGPHGPPGARGGPMGPIWGPTGPKIWNFLPLVRWCGTQSPTPPRVAHFRIGRKASICK